MSEPIQTDLVVLGSGPGGYSAAFRAADLGLNVTLVERFDKNHDGKLDENERREAMESIRKRGEEN